MYELPELDRIVVLALAEDLGVSPDRFAPGASPSFELLDLDVTSSAVVGPDALFGGRIVAREECVVCGLPVVGAVFERLSAAAGLFEPVEAFPLVAEGSRVSAGTPVAEVGGLALAVLAGERTALDFLMILSGIATQTARWVEAAGPGLAVCDTRKTSPGLRELSKYAVAVGGGTNHRHGLHDMVLVKDNHIERAGGIEAAATRAREAHPELLLEIEADTIEQAVEAAGGGADIVLLDNMDDSHLADAVFAVHAVAAEAGRAVLTEASGSITFERLASLAQTGVDRVSSSALTLGATPVDFGLDEV